MYSIRNILIASTAVVVLILGLASVKAQGVLNGEPTSVGVVDLRTLYDSLREKQQIDAELETVRTSLTDERDKRQKDLAQLQQDLDMLVPGTPPYAEAQDKYEKAALDYQLWAAYQQNKVARENNARIEDLTNKADAAIEAVAEAQNVDIVLFKQQTIRLGTNQQGRIQAANINIVAWAGKDVDITSAVAQQMNNEFENQ